MSVTTMPASRAPRPSSLADVLDVILDKGIVIDLYVRVSLVGIEVLTIDARIVIASVDTYLRFAEAVNRLDLQPQGQVAGLPGLMNEMREGGAKHKTKGALSGAKEKASELMGSVRDKWADDSEDDEPEDEPEYGGSNGGRSLTSRSRSGRSDGDDYDDYSENGRQAARDRRAPSRRGG